MTQSDAILVLADGSVFEGRSIGAPGTVVGEVVFNTGMTGYQEILTDPSYGGQIVTLTYPLIGNYGINDDDDESARIRAAGLVVRSATSEPSNWRSKETLPQRLLRSGTVGIDGVDTRALTLALREHGVMMGGISTKLDAARLVDTVRSSADYGSIDQVRAVSAGEAYVWPAATPDPQFRVSVLDCGVKYNILRSLAERGCAVTVYPCTATAGDLLSGEPDGVMLSPGPGDPALLDYAVQTVRDLVGKVPIMGVCLGNQLLGCAFGSETYKLRFGHRGSNHPVQDLATGRVVITSQNHGYAIDGDKLRDGMEVAHVNLNDGTVEGLRHTQLPIFSIQYHPEASPGPHDSASWFDEFTAMMARARG